MIKTTRKPAAAPKTVKANLKAAGPVLDPAGAKSQSELLLVDSTEDVDLCAIDSEPWVVRSTECPYVAAYHAGRLLHFVDWLLLHIGLRGPWTDGRIDSVFGQIVQLLPAILPAEAHSDVLEAVDQLRHQWSGFLNSEAHDVWRESPGEWSRVAGQVWQEQHSSVISEAISLHLESRQRDILALGYDVDDGTRPLKSMETLNLAWSHKVTADDLHFDPVWYGNIRAKCLIFNIGEGLPTCGTSPLTTAAAHCLMSLVETLDQQIRLNLEGLWLVDHPVENPDDGESQQPGENEQAFAIALAGQSRNIFRRNGNSWTVVFGGTMVPMVHRDGLLYVAELLRRPEESATASDLRACKHVLATEPAGRDFDPKEEGLNRGTGDAGEILDAEAFKEYWNRLAEIGPELDAANKNNDAAEITRLEDERQSIRQQLRDANAPGGKLARLARDSKKDRDAVRNAINRAMKTMKNQHEPLYRHLKRYLRTSPQFVYDPDPKIEWEL